MNDFFDKQYNHTEDGSLAVTTSLYHPRLVNCLVERLAFPGSLRDHYSGNTLPDWKAIETSSVEVFLSGEVILSTPSEQINMPFISNFFFTCTRTDDRDFKISWATSLS